LRLLVPPHSSQRTPILTRQFAFSDSTSFADTLNRKHNRLTNSTATVVG
jgi:hypothetical protein